MTFKGSQRQTELADKINTFIRRQNGLTFPRHTLLLSRATGLVEGLCMDLLPDRNFFDIIRPRLTRVLSWQSQVRWFGSLISERFNQWQALPARIESMQRAIDQQAKRDDGVMLIVCTIAFFGAMLLPEDYKWWVAGVADE